MKFIDSNLWLYALDGREIEKRERAIDLCASLDVCVSTQVVNEVLFNLRKKHSAAESQIKAVLAEFKDEYDVREVTMEDIALASELREEYSFSYWDSLIVASALRAAATDLYSEDMQNGLIVRGRLTIINPFV